MVEAFLWGLLAASSLVLGAIVVAVHEPRDSNLGLILGFGAGVLISAVSFELVEEAANVAGGEGGVAFGLFCGALVYFFGDQAIERLESRREAEGGGNESGAAFGIVLGTVLDGIPESAVLGLTLVQEGTVSAAMLVAVFVSNLPESIAASSSLVAGGWSARAVYLLWIGVAVASAIASALGFVLLDDASNTVLSFVLAFAGGAILCMLTSTMVPAAYERTKLATGLAATLGFSIAFFINWVAR